MNGHKAKSSHPAPESRVGEEGTSKRNITRKGGVKVSNRIVWYSRPSGRNQEFLSKVYTKKARYVSERELTELEKKTYMFNFCACERLYSCVWEAT